MAKRIRLDRGGSGGGRVGDTSVGPAVLTFVLASLVAVLALVAGGVFVLRELGRREAVREARVLAGLAAHGIVEPNLEEGLLEGRPAALERIDRVVRERVLSDRVVRVKLWTQDGRIVYSDEPRLVGLRFSVADNRLHTFGTGRANAELSDLTEPENRYERGYSRLLEVYLPVRTPSGEPLLFELYERFDSVVAGGRRVWLSFLPPLLGSLLLLWLVQVPLAWSLARRLKRSHRDRVALLLQAAEASSTERRRIAADLHDGVVQDLAGISYALAAAAASPPQSAVDLSRTLREAATRTRQSMRRLRSLLVEIHPPNLRSAGLQAAISDLLAPLASRGVATSVEVPDALALTPDLEALLFRAAAEALRNVDRHANARTVGVRVLVQDGLVRLVVRDDGRGFSPAERDQHRADGHVGLSLLEDTIAYAGGRLEVHSEPGKGTTFVLEAPRS